MIVVVVGASVAFLVSAGSAPGKPKGPERPETVLQRQQAVTRKQAATWLAQQVGHSTLMACDPAMCSAIEHQGFPAKDLSVLRRNSLTPKGSALVIETTYVSTLLGTS